MCECSDPMHHFIIRYGESGGRRLVYFNIVLQRDVSLCRRLHRALRYAFGRFSCRDSNMAEVVLGRNSAEAFRRITDYLSEEDDFESIGGMTAFPESGKERKSSAVRFSGS